MGDILNPLVQGCCLSGASGDLGGDAPRRFADVSRVREVGPGRFRWGGRRGLDETCFVWDSTGRLVALATQLAGVRLG